MTFKFRFLGKAVLILAAIAVLGWLVMLLWNAVVPAVFAGSHPVDYLHALGLLILSRILFGGFHGRGGRRGQRWEKWQAMTADEREQFRQNMRRGRSWDNRE
ncbi:hypothetical protein [Rhodanobacter sp. A1T4]|jgi:hypothetical protein|uniref:hypothetical protein n=1 Tax=Rhodanobacter sp. A1T4 TaxID=2723087 RepID=UPI00160E6E13|nr:hypothetical protein [Rhodanobacter sp. A1T4]MBB6246503.1 hypothetical protein [Rhodanobacter sp. A1T4]